MKSKLTKRSWPRPLPCLNCGKMTLREDRLCPKCCPSIYRFRRKDRQDMNDEREYRRRHGGSVPQDKCLVCGGHLDDGMCPGCDGVAGDAWERGEDVR